MVYAEQDRLPSLFQRSQRRNHHGGIRRQSGPELSSSKLSMNLPYLNKGSLTARHRSRTPAESHPHRRRIHHVSTHGSKTPRLSTRPLPSETESIFHASKVQLRSLWKKFRTPLPHRQLFAKRHFSSITNENIIAITSEITHVLEDSQRQHRIENLLETRDELLKQIKQLEHRDEHFISNTNRILQTTCTKLCICLRTLHSIMHEDYTERDFSWFKQSTLYPLVKGDVERDPFLISISFDQLTKQRIRKERKRQRLAKQQEEKKKKHDLVEKKKQRKERRRKQRHIMKQDSPHVPSLPPLDTSIIHKPKNHFQRHHQEESTEILSTRKSLSPLTTTPQKNNRYRSLEESTSLSTKEFLKRLPNTLSPSPTNSPRSPIFINQQLIDSSPYSPTFKQHSTPFSSKSRFEKRSLINPLKTRRESVSPINHLSSNDPQFQPKFDFLNTTDMFDLTPIKRRAPLLKKSPSPPQKSPSPPIKLNNAGSPLKSRVPSPGRSPLLQRLFSKRHNPYCPCCRSSLPSPPSSPSLSLNDKYLQHRQEIHQQIVRLRCQYTMEDYLAFLRGDSQNGCWTVRRYTPCRTHPGGKLSLFSTVPVAIEEDAHFSRFASFGKRYGIDDANACYTLFMLASHDSIIRIQKWWRGYLSRRRLRVCKKASSTLGRLTRGFLARQQMDRIFPSLVRIRCCLWLERIRLRRRSRLSLWFAAWRLQCWWRRVQKKKKQQKGN
mmetsp:Transcript_8605/g.12691  ORF Transcript_8605/g.12691 Transcript_8605/m.12691 type:complete len:721 (+) Transcript_8605:204-2366(+)